MGKLNIAHHNSDHPYRRDNVECVRRDEEEAAQKEAEAQLNLLRERAGLGRKRKRTT
jgi:hypothetical protein